MKSRVQYSECPLCLRFDEELRKLKEMLLTQVEGLMRHVEEAAGEQSERIEGIRKALKDEVAALEMQLKEKQEALQSKDIATQELEDRLVTRIHTLENQIEHLQGLLQARDNELLEIRSLLASKDEEAETLKSDLLEKKLLIAKFEKNEWRSVGKNRGWKLWAKSSTD